MSRRTTPAGFRPAVEPLEDRMMPSVTTVAERESNNTKSAATAFSLTPGNQVKLQGASRGTRDADYFKFTATQGGTLSVSVASTNGHVPKLSAASADMVFGSTAPAKHQNA